ncbi:hypothetical protein KKB17_04330 [bacterium]|nr:hypothetical protein [bacterium]
MPVGKNINLEDKLIKKTTSKASNKNIVSITRKTNITRKAGMSSPNAKTDTYKTRKMTFYIKGDLLQKLYNFAYWDRHSLTEAFNIVVRDGLKEKGVKQRPKSQKES